MSRCPEFQEMLREERKRHQQEIAQLKKELSDTKRLLKPYKEFATAMRSAYRELDGRELMQEVKDCLQDLGYSLKSLKK